MDPDQTPRSMASDQVGTVCALFAINPCPAVFEHITVSKI